MSAKDVSTFSFSGPTRAQGRITHHAGGAEQKRRRRRRRRDVSPEVLDVNADLRFILAFS